MALQTHEDIKSALSDWMARNDTRLTNRIPDLITMFEARVNRSLRTPEFEFRATTTTTADDPYVALPSGFRGMRVMKISSTDPATPLQYVTPQTMNRRYASAGSGTPLHFTTQGDELRLSPTPSSALTLEMIYFKGITPLADATTDAQKWLLLDHPDIYIYGPLNEATEFVQNFPRADRTERSYQQRMEEIKQEAKRSRHSAGPLVAVPDFYTP